MLNTHFFKFLFGFTAMIIVGIIGLYLIDSYNKENGGESTSILPF